jgi:hypothetical protein
MGFDHVTVAQNGRNCSDEEKRKPERIDVLLEDRAGTSGRSGT